jgi:hypothetical protein
MRSISLITLLVLTPAVAGAQDTTRSLSLGGFVDTYFAWDFNRPGPTNLDRSFTTQPARHNEFNVNLAHVEVKLSGGRTRGRVALQAGTAVQSNYAGEPRLGSVSGPELARHIQEATVGVQAASNLWIDAGIYFSHIGQESWITRDNPTYSRSLIADYSPYYETGVKATWSASSKVTAQLHLLNGWQNISETNAQKAVGLRLDYAASPNFVIGYAGFAGDEQPDTAFTRVRVFNEVFMHLTAGSFEAWVTADHGIQERTTTGTSKWYGGAAIARVKATPRVAVAARVERYWDPDQVIIGTGLAEAFRVNGGSLGLDIVPATGALWRIEARGYRGEDAIFPTRTGVARGAGFVVSSLAVTF